MGHTIKLGSKYRDVITKFEGTATAVCERLFEEYPDVRIERPLQPDGKQSDAWFNANRIELIDELVPATE